MLNLVLFGGPGAGKGTQAAKLVEHYGLLHVSTGDLIRAEIKAESPLGIEAKRVTESGSLLSDELVIGMIKNFVAANRDAKGIIFDGFPRTTPQAEAFDVMLEEVGVSVTLMTALDVNEEELVKRLQGRAIESGRKDDSDINIIKNRIKVYNDQTAVVADFYKAQGKFFAIDGIGTIDEIFSRLCTAIDQFAE